MQFNTTEYKELQEWSEMQKTWDYGEKVNKMTFNVEKEKANRKLQPTKKMLLQNQKIIFLYPARYSWAEQ